MSSLKGGVYNLDRETGVYTTYRNKIGGSKGYVQVRRQRKVAEYTGTCECLECGNCLKMLAHHLSAQHGLTVPEYRAKHGAGTPVIDEQTKAERVAVLVGKAQDVHRKEARRKFAAHARLKCAMCGVEFCYLPGHKATLTCTPECLAAMLSRDRTGSPAYIAAAIRNAHAPKRLAYIETLKQRRIKDRSRICTVCGRPWTSSRRSKSVTAGVCSYKCRSKRRRAQWEAEHPKQPCGMCGRLFWAVVSGHTRLFCSTKCYGKARSTDPVRRAALAAQASKNAKANPQPTDKRSGRFVKAEAARRAVGKGTPK